ncbi:hypothetical protein ACYVVI_00790 [Arenicellales bacterium IMCC57338]
MSISDQVRVNAHYTRSVNLDRDRKAKAVLESYIPTTRAIQTLERISGTFNQGDIPRSWALIGPYGSGKSAFSVFLAHLLGDGGSATNKAALRKLRKARPSVANEYRRNLGKEDRYCQVLFSGGPQSFGKALVTQLAKGSAEFWDKKRGKKPSVIGKLDAAANKEFCDPAEIIYLLKELQVAVANAGGKGVLIGIDELGKFLEYEARHYGQNEVFLLQMLAEHAQKDSPAPVSVVVLLHQSFEQYARGLGEALKAEWAKIQGRFETVPFLESSEQILRVVAAAINSSFSKNDMAQIEESTSKEIKLLKVAGVLPQGLNEQEATALFIQCYPLHPVTALMLPVLCQKVAQNERTLFSYLGSYEPSGFLDSLGSLRSVDEKIMPDRLYDYFVQNQPTAVTDPLASRRWAEIVNAVERLGDAPKNEIALVKLIGLFNLVGAQGRFRAGKDLLKSCISSRALNQAIKSLEEQSIVQYRRYSKEYRVWQGSDFDIERAVDEVRSELGRFSISSVLSERDSVDPVVARRHSIEKGSLRYFPIVFYDRESAEALSVPKGIPQITLVDSLKSKKAPALVCFLAEGREDIKFFSALLETLAIENDVFGVCPLGPQLRHAISEVSALERVQHLYPDLARDPIALSELRTRLAAAQYVESEIIASILDKPENSDWFWRGKPLSAQSHKVKNRRFFQSALSEVMDAIYEQAPIISNELINRDRPSAQANSARNRLLERLLIATDKPDLGIEKNPPEKSIYDSVLKATGLHRKGKTGFGIYDPESKNKFNFDSFWQETRIFLDDSEKTARSLDELSEILTAPPFGLKRGVLPLMFVLVLLRYQDDIALYENKVYTPYLTKEIIDRLVKRPKDFTVQRFKIAGLRRSIFKEYAEALFADGAAVSDIISVARPLAKFMSELPEYAQQTKRLSEEAIAVRDAFRIAKSPQKLLFELIPKACRRSKTSSRKKNDDGFASTLVEVLRELKYAIPRLQDDMQRAFCEAFRLDKTITLQQLQEIIRGRFMGLESYTIDSDGLKAFIQRVVASEKDEEKWFSNLLYFLGRKPVSKWSDVDRDSAELRLIEFSRRINDLEKLRIHYDQFGKSDSDHEAYLIKTSSRLTGEKDEVVFLNEERSKAIEIVVSSIKDKLGEIEENDLRLAALAKVADELLGEYRESQKNRSVKGKKDGQKKA